MTIDQLKNYQLKMEAFAEGIKYGVEKAVQAYIFEIERDAQNEIKKDLNQNKEQQNG